MSEAPKPLPDQLGAECKSLLMIGKVKEKMANLERLMHENYTDAEGLEDVFSQQFVRHEGDGREPISIEEQRRSIVVLAEMLGGDENPDAAIQAAQDFIQLRKLEIDASAIENSMHYKALMIHHGLEDSPQFSELNVAFEAAVDSLKASLARVSESPAFVRDIAIQSYVDTLAYHMRLPQHGASLDI